MAQAENFSLSSWLSWDNASNSREKTKSIGDSGADMCLNCSFSVKSMKFGTETVFKMTKKIGYGGKPEIAVLPS